MKFSIATPVFNGLPWLPCCLASVRDQGVDSEHIVHDGGSTDGSLDVLRGTTDLIWESASDGGMYDAINRCWRKAGGEILSYLNCDEQYLPGALDKVAHAFEADPRLDLLFGDALVIGADGRPISYRRVVTPLRWHTIVVHLGTMSCSMFFRRRLLEAGLFFDTRWRAIGDADWVLRALRMGCRMRALGEPLAAFAMTGENLGGGIAAAEEAMRWKREAPWLARTAAPLLSAHHRLRKLLAGAYRPRTIETSLYTPASPAARVPTRASDLTHRWPE